MKKNLKRTLAKVMAVALTVAMAGTAAPDADAAKKIKLSSKSITVTAKGKAKKVTIKNVTKNKVKKLTVKSDKKKIATVKKVGKTAFKVTGKKAGSAKITASVTLKGKKKATKLTLKVKVKKAVAPTPAPSVAPTAAASAAPTAAATASATAPSASAPAPSASAPAPSASAPAPSESAPAPSESAPAPAETQATEIKNIQLGGINSKIVTYFAVSEEGSADVILNSNAQYGNTYTYFDFTLPEKASWSDIQEISFDFEGVKGDLSSKSLFLLAGVPKSAEESFDIMPGEIDYNWTINEFRNVAEVGNRISFSGAALYEDQKFTIDRETLSKLDNLDRTVRFSIFVNLGGAEGTEYKLSNIKVIGTAKGTDASAARGTTVDYKTAEPLTPVADPASAEIKIGESVNLTANANNLNVYGTTIAKTSWALTGENNPENYATIDANTGKVTAKAVPEGAASVDVKATATMELANGCKISTTATVKIVDPNATVAADVVFASTETQDATGYIKFANMTCTTGNEEGFDFSKYSKVIVKAKLMKEDGSVITGKLSQNAGTEGATHVSYAKILPNNSTDDVAMGVKKSDGTAGYGPGYGDGYCTNWVQNLNGGEADENGILTKEFTIDKDTWKGIDCISYQLGGDLKKIIIESVTFTAK